MHVILLITYQLPSAAPIYYFFTTVPKWKTLFDIQSSDLSSTRCNSTPSYRLLISFRESLLIVKCKSLLAAEKYMFSQLFHSASFLGFHSHFWWQELFNNAATPGDYYPPATILSRALHRCTNRREIRTVTQPLPWQTSHKSNIFRLFQYTIIASIGDEINHILCSPYRSWCR